VTRPLCARCNLKTAERGIMCDECRAAPRPPGPMTPGQFEAACRQITEEKTGHAAHRALDLLTNDCLCGLGYGGGIDVFESAVRHWHDPAHPYPHAGPFPDCEESPSVPVSASDQGPGQ